MRQVGNLDALHEDQDFLVSLLGSVGRSLPLEEIDSVHTSITKGKVITTAANNITIITLTPKFRWQEAPLLGCAMVRGSF